MCAVKLVLIEGTWARAGGKGLMARGHDLGFEGLQWGARRGHSVWEDIQGIELAELGDQA